MPAFAGMTERETADLLSELLGQDTSSAAANGTAPSLKAPSGGALASRKGIGAREFLVQFYNLGIPRDLSDTLIIVCGIDG